MPLIYQMSDIAKAEGDDYSCYSADSRKIIASCASVAVSIKSVLDTPLLTDDGLLTDASEGTATNIEVFFEESENPILMSDNFCKVGCRKRQPLFLLQYVRIT